MARGPRSNYNSKRRPPQEEKEERYISAYEGYLSYPMTAADEKACDTLDWSKFNLATWMQEEIENGYRIVIGLSKTGESVMCEVQCIDTRNGWHGYRLSAGGPDLETALQTLFYKHVVALGREWDRAPAPASREERKRW